MKMHVENKETSEIDASLDELRRAETAAKERVERAARQAESIMAKAREKANAIVAEANEQAAHIRTVEMEKELKLVKAECNEILNRARAIEDKIGEIDTGKTSEKLLVEFVKLIKEDN